LAIILALIFVSWAWGRYVAEPYIDQGRAEVQVKWDKREKELASEFAQALKIAIDIERKRSGEIQEAASKRLKEIQDERNALADSLDTERRVNKRLRTITGKTVAKTDGVSGVSIALTGSDDACRAELPAEIGEGFERLREIALRIGSEANELAILHTESQRVHSINAGE